MPSQQHETASLKPGELLDFSRVVKRLISSDAKAKISTEEARKQIKQLRKQLPADTSDSDLRSAGYYVRLAAFRFYSVRPAELK